jgi:hypothetical protein
MILCPFLSVPRCLPVLGHVGKEWAMGVGEQGQRMGSESQEQEVGEVGV